LNIPAKSSAVLEWTLRHEYLTVMLSLAVQIPLGLFLGHMIDSSTFMATGYLVGTGQSPYIPQDLSGVFGLPQFGLQQLSVIGYPPPWPLLLGVIYDLTYRWLPNLLIYNLAIKAPVITSNILLAYTVRWMLRGNGASEGRSQWAWFFMLFNPFIVLTTAAWGQIDTIVALLILLSISMLQRGRFGSASVVAALAVATKQIALPIFFFSAAYVARGRVKRALRYAILFGASLFVFYVLPFFVFGWNASFALGNWNDHLTIGGGLTLFNFLEYFNNSMQLPAGWGVFGYLWIPALAIGGFALWRRKGDTGFPEMIRDALFIFLLFFLSLSWLSEPNFNLIIPMAVMLVALNRLELKILHLIWIIPLVFAVLNYSLPLLLFPVYPSIANALASLDHIIRPDRLLVRGAVAVSWTALGWFLVWRIYSRPVRRAASVKQSRTAGG